MIGIDRRKLRAMSHTDLLLACGKLSAEWERKGRPDEAHMPLIMLTKYVALRQELDRRGQQLTIFDALD